MNKMNTDLRKYLQKNHHQITWKERIQIVHNIMDGLYKIHKENAFHRDLHSGNILFFNNFWFIGDLGFCGPADKSLKSIYGNLSYIAPEVIVGKEYTFASDIYSIGMLMWEISSGQPPFAGFDHNYDLAMKIINGMRPKIVSGIPLEYKKLMEQCWDAILSKRPDGDILFDKIDEINILYYQEQTNNNISINNVQLNTNYISSSSINSLARKFSQIHIF